MARTVIRLGPGECSNVETGARYFAALAFPGTRERAEREQAAVAKAAQYLHEENRVDETDAPFQDPRLNDYLVKIVTTSVGRFQKVMDELLAKDIGIEKFSSRTVLRRPIEKREYPIELIAGKRVRLPQS